MDFNPVAVAEALFEAAYTPQCPSETFIDTSFTNLELLVVLRDHSLTKHHFGGVVYFAWTF